MNEKINDKQLQEFQDGVNIGYFFTHSSPDPQILKALLDFVEKNQHNKVCRGIKHGYKEAINELEKANAKQVDSKEKDIEVIQQDIGKDDLEL